MGSVSNRTTLRLPPELIGLIATQLLGERQASHRSKDLQRLRLTCWQVEKNIFKVWTSSYSTLELDNQNDINDTVEMLHKSSKVVETLNAIILRHTDQLYGSKVRQILATVPKLKDLRVLFDYDLKDPAKFDVLPEATAVTLQFVQPTISKDVLQHFLQRTKCRRLTLVVDKCFEDCFQVLLEAQLETLEVRMHSRDLPDNYNSTPLPERLRGREGMTRRVHHSKFRLQWWKMKGFQLWGQGPEMVKNMIERVLEIYESARVEE